MVADIEWVLNTSGTGWYAKGPDMRTIKLSADDEGGFTWGVFHQGARLVVEGRSDCGDVHDAQQEAEAAAQAAFHGAFMVSEDEQEAGLSAARRAAADEHVDRLVQHIKEVEAGLIPADSPVTFIRSDWQADENGKPGWFGPDWNADERSVDSAGEARAD